MLKQQEVHQTLWAISSFQFMNIDFLLIDK